MLREIGVPDPGQLASLFGPAGLDLGAESPEAIGLSILAEAHAVLSRASAAHLRERHGSIHPRGALRPALSDVVARRHA
jgi:xanthine/CO dehydrogenase XdhC/CoxF family maturation factor